MSQIRPKAPTAIQIEAGINSRYKNIRYAWSKRQDFKPTSEHAERGLTDIEGASAMVGQDVLILRRHFNKLSAA